MKKTLAFFAVLACILTAQAQKKNFSYQFYGFVRGDLFYNTRANQAPVDGNFYLYPLDKDLDDNGKDINATPNGSFYTFTTRLGVDMQGPKVGKAETSAKVEMDFGGFSSSTTMLRIRQAYVKLDWKRVGVLIGQTWHPLFGKVVPDVLNLSTGAPFQPFNREPQIAVSYRTIATDCFYLANSAEGNMKKNWIQEAIGFHGLCIFMKKQDFVPRDGKEVAVTYIRQLGAYWKLCKFISEITDSERDEIISCAESATSETLNYALQDLQEPQNLRNNLENIIAAFQEKELDYTRLQKGCDRVKSYLTED